MERLTFLVSSGKYLSPADAVLLYQQLYVLKNFLEYGTVVANQIRVGYAEEFRYCIVPVAFFHMFCPSLSYNTVLWPVSIIKGKTIKYAYKPSGP